MHFKRFQQGDEVSYIGTKTFFDDDDKPINIRDSRGEVVGRVQNSEVGVVVEFDGRNFIMDETRHLAKYVRKVKPEAEQTKGPEVQKRRGMTSGEGGKGKKRRNQSEDAG